MRPVSRLSACVARTTHGIALVVLTLSAPHLLAQERPATTGDSARKLEAVTVTAIRAGGVAPISAKTITLRQIEPRYFGQDIPLVLQSAPSLTSYSETGTYWGYSYMRLRGIDQSRINLTLDGIPLNDPEDQVLYFADFPDLANSLQSVQIQRGTGTSSNGTAAYAGSINFETLPIASLRRGGEVQVGGGSFGAKRASVEYQTGLLPNRFAFYGRLSGYQVEGYRYHSGMEGASGFFSGGWFGDRDIVKVIATAGLFADTLSYLAVPDAELESDRRINPLRPDELDRFGEQLVSVAYTRLFGERSALATTVYRISASGNYDVFIDPDLWNFNLDFRWYGATSAWNWSADRWRVDAGVNGNTYSRDHHTYVRPDFSQGLYFNTGHKRDASGFAKVGYDAGRLSLFGDLQARWAEFRYTPDENAGIAERSISWRFLNPKLGATLDLSRGVSVYASYGVNSREPARSDMFAGFDNLDTSNADFVGSLDRVRPERAHDVEAGVTLESQTASIAANVFDMRFRNEILPIGALSYIGTPLRKNVGRSRRYGVEIDATWRGIPRLLLTGSATAMRGRIDEYVDDATGITYRGVEPLLTPRWLFAHRAELQVAAPLRLGVEGRYTGRSFLRNTGERQFMLPASYLLDASLSWRPFGGRHELLLQGNNLTDSRQFASGYSDGSQSYYYVLPPRNVMVTLRVGF